MALRTIVQDGDPILKKKCRPVTAFDDRLAQLLDDMRETLADANGYGLAGPQVGVMRRPAKVKARAFDRNGNPFEIEAEGMLARCICHENDHLNGVTILDRAEYFYEDLEEDEIEEEE